MTTRLLLTLLAAAAVVIAVGVASVRERGGREYVILLSEAPGLREGAPVSYLGVPSGHVVSIDLGSGRVAARVRIRRADVILRAGDLVRLRPQGVVGDPMIELAPGLRDAPALGPGDTLRVLD